MEDRILLINKDKYSLEATKNQDGYYYYKFLIEGVIRWHFKAYEYETDGIASYKIPAPYGLDVGDYAGAIKKLSSFFKVV